jgi:putative hydrolase of the HAD superfamily
LKPEEAIVFEDSPNGVTAAISAGIFVVAVPNPLTRQLTLDHADLLLDSLTDLSLGEIITMANHS